MLKRLCLLILFIPGICLARPIAEYFPKDIKFNPAVPSPEAFLGWEVGNWHVNHSQLTAYMHKLAETSERISIEEIGRSWEQRPLLLLTITSANNQAQLESLRKQHLEQKAEAPLVLWMGYSVHGNEASGSNAALLFAWYLAAANDPILEQQLQDTIIILEPSLNPDGMNRFASWVNANRSQNLVADVNDREHNEPWPGGRTNHYWFDLNRDWLLLQHPESRARVKAFHQWRPHVLTDFHEQGRNAHYFFQPGVPARGNPLTPGKNFDLTKALGAYHAAALDAAGELYFSRERFDDFYYGKGSTYPDINGSIGILFEQATARGHLTETDFGQRHFADGIANHLTTSFSTLNGSWALREKLKSYQQGFNAQLLKLAKTVTHSGWIVADDGDSARMQGFLKVLAGHQIQARPVNEALTLDGVKYSAGHSWFLPVEQANAGLLMAIMDIRTQFEDNTFYDVSAWNLAEAFNLPWQTTSRSPALLTQALAVENTVPDLDSALALLINWSNQNAPASLARLLKAGYSVRSSGKSFQMDRGGPASRSGDLIVNLHGLSQAQRVELSNLLTDIQATKPVPMAVIHKGYAETGVDLGSGGHRLIPLPKPLLWTGDDVDAYAAGEVWHLLDQNIGLALVRINTRQLKQLDLSKYTHLLMVDGSYPEDKKLQKKIADWVHSGGILVSARRAANWASGLFEPQPDHSDSSLEDPSEESIEAPRNYADFENDEAQQIVGGAIIETRLDLSHPLAFGYQRQRLPMMRNGTVLLNKPGSPYSTVASYSKQPLISGFMSPAQKDAISLQPAVIADRQGEGLIVRFANNPNFRAYFKGSSRLYINSLFFSGMVNNTDL